GVRVIAATNMDLENAVQTAQFRADLYYRLKVVEITIPPLRDRLEDVPMLSTHFLDKFAKELNLAAQPRLSPELVQHLQTEQWDGNVRQLENSLYSALIHARPPYLLTPADFPRKPPALSNDTLEASSSFDMLSKKLLLKTLADNDWDTAKTAEKLHVSRGTVYYRLKKYGIDPKDFSR
ncbi:MAG: sigma 54-interacting transcriptional regulator, partial [Nitrospiria bacterium]